MFYHIAYIGKKVESALKSKCDFTITQMSDIKFYVLYALFAKISGKVIITPNDVAIMQINIVSDDVIIDVANEVFAMYTELGGNDRVAKGSNLIAKLKEKLQATIIS